MDTITECSIKSPYRIKFTGGGDAMNVVSNTKTGTENLSSSNGIIAQATRVVRECSLYYIESKKGRRQMSYVALGRLHELRAAAAMDPAIMKGLEKQSQMPRRNDTSDHLYVAKAVLKLAGSELKPQTASDWANVLRGLELADVRPDSHQVVEWLNAPDEETGATGYEKAFAFVKRAPKDGSHAVAAEARAAKKLEEKQQAWS